MKCFTFWENIKTISILYSENYKFILNTCHDTRNWWKQGWVFPLFSTDSDDRLSLNLHRFVILYRSCDTRSVGLGQYCLPKVSNGFKRRWLLCSLLGVAVPLLQFVVSIVFRRRRSKRYSWSSRRPIRIRSHPSPSQATLSMSTLGRALLEVSTR